MELFDDYRTKRLKNRIAGRWFPANRSRFNRLFETIGRSLAMTIRVLLRKKIGVETYNLWMVITGILWIRLCLSIGAHIGAEASWTTAFISLFPFYSVGTGILTVFNYLFLLACLYYVLRTEFGNQEGLNVDDRGQSNLLEFLIHEDAPILLRKAFVQAVIAPMLGLLISCILLWFQFAAGLQIFLIGSSLALLIDEINYHRALIRLRRILVSKQVKARDQMEQLRKYQESKYKPS